MDTRGLIFPFKSLIDECEALKLYAGDVLDKKTVASLDEAKSTLQNIQRAGTGRSTRWVIPLDRPLRTIWSDGESQPKNRSGHKVKGQFTFVWAIRTLDEDKWRNGKYFLLDGLASTVIEVIEERDGEAERCIARWTVEVGDHQSPGAHFHFQLNGFDAPPFPKSLDVPRLPALLMSPFLAIDLAIGELFQDRWSKYSVSESKGTKWWRGIQQERLLRFFKWQSDCVAKCTGSPWMALKLAKPDRELLVAGA